MQKLFNNILVPVNFDKQSEIAIDKAIDIARQFSCDVHFLHVTKAASELPGFGSISPLQNIKQVELNKKLDNLKMYYAHRITRKNLIHTHIQAGIIENVISEYVLIHGIDLLLIGRMNSHFLASFFSRFSINKISEKVGCPVLTVMSNPLHNTIRTIVLPVTDHLPLRKVMLATYLSKSFHSSIHLISLEKKSSAADATANKLYLAKTFQLLKENTDVHVECRTIAGENIAICTLEYAKQINADLIMVNPGNETRLSGVNRLFQKFLFNASDIPVITMA